MESNTRIAECGVDTGKVTSSYSYVEGGYGTNSTTPLVAKITQPKVSFEYAYDSRGNIISEKRGTLTTTYAYDALGQLIRVNDPHENATWVYNYDCGGNILSKVKYAYTTGTLGTAQQTISYTYGDSNWKDKLTAYNGTAITYDAIGNPLSDGTWTYTWQAGRQLKQMSKSGTTIRYEYNHEGLRTQKFVDTNNKTDATYYTYNGKNIIHVIKNSDHLHIFYGAQNRPAKVSHNGIFYTYLYNLQGDVIGLLDKDGALVVEYKYDAWGKPLSITGTLAATLGKLNPFRYRGYVYDDETGLYYLRSRYYNPVWGKFINADTIVGLLGDLNSHNAFTYCFNTPTVLADSNGRCAISVTCVVGIGKKVPDEIVSACVRSLVDAVMQKDYTRSDGKLVSYSVKKSGYTLEAANYHNATVQNVIRWTKRLLGAGIGYYVADPFKKLKGIAALIAGWVTDDIDDEITGFVEDAYTVLPGEYTSIQATFQYSHKHLFALECENEYVSYDIRIYGSGYMEVWRSSYGCNSTSAGAQKIGAITRAELGY